MDWTHSPMRCLLRLICPDAILYTEMITSGAIIHGNTDKHLAYDKSEHPIILQLGGSDPKDLAHAARKAAHYGYDGLNLNCGCPSPRVQSGAFGACLMAEPLRVADCVKAMADASGLPVSVKHRLGIGYEPKSEKLEEFVETVSNAGVCVFVVHARTAILEGLSPKQNRQIPPLDYSALNRLKERFPHLNFILNGGLTNPESVPSVLGKAAGLMIGRAACHDPFILQRFALALRTKDPGLPTSRITQAQTVNAYLDLAAQSERPLRQHLHPLHSVFRGLKGGRNWRRSLTQIAANHIRSPKQGIEEAKRCLDEFVALDGAPTAH